MKTSLLSHFFKSTNFVPSLCFCITLLFSSQTNVAIAASFELTPDQINIKLMNWANEFAQSHSKAPAKDLEDYLVNANTLPKNKDELAETFFEAAKIRHEPILAYMILEGFTTYGTVPVLHFLAMYNFAETIDFLFTYKKNYLDINEKTLDSGWAPLHMAAQYKNPEALTILIAHGADINACSDVTEQTPLHLAAINGSAQIAQHLVEAGALINQPDYDGRTALHYSAINYDSVYKEVLYPKVSESDLSISDKYNWNPSNQFALRKAGFWSSLSLGSIIDTAKSGIQTAKTTVGSMKSNTIGRVQNKLDKLWKNNKDSAEKVVTEL